MFIFFGTANSDPDLNLGTGMRYLQGGCLCSLADVNLLI